MVKIYVVSYVGGSFMLKTASYNPEAALKKWKESTYFNPSIPVTIVTFEQTTKEKRCTATNM